MLRLQCCVTVTPASAVCKRVAGRLNINGAACQCTHIAERHAAPATLSLQPDDRTLSPKVHSVNTGLLIWVSIRCVVNSWVCNVCTANQWGAVVSAWGAVVSGARWSCGRASGFSKKGQWFETTSTVSKLGQFRSPDFACVFRKRQ